MRLVNRQDKNQKPDGPRRLKPQRQSPFKDSGQRELPLVPLKGLVIFPNTVVPFFAGRESSVAAVDEAMSSDRLLFLACQKTETEEPEEEDIHPYGTLSRIMQVIKLPDGNIRVLVEGLERGVILKYTKKKPACRVQVVLIPDLKEVTTTTSALMQILQVAFQRYAKYHKKLPQESAAAVDRAEFPDKLADLIATHINIKPETKVELLSIKEPAERLERLSVILEAENEVAALQGKINSEVKKRLEKGQKEYFLNEQIREIHKELGRGDDDVNGARELEAKLQEKPMPEEIREKAQKELKRLSRLAAMSPESGVLRTYLEWICDLPWMEKSEDRKDIDEAEIILNEDHYDLKKAKERILDFIAVHQLKDRMKGPILCFVGPPGTGKTSLGRSVARALGREFVRISLGGVRDEAEIRGHRKTYVGALPGKIIQALKRVGTVNPVFLLDEIDKINSDFRGDPASALLEVLDPEQNFAFADHYMEVPYDLSRVMFITTANSMHNIPHPLRDRMEIIEINGYSDFEKVQIAREFIIPKQLMENGLDWADIKFHKNGIMKIIHGYTMESGVRNLEREIAAIIRKIARKAVKQGYTSDSLQKTAPEGGPENQFTCVVTAGAVPKYLGAEKFQENKVLSDMRPGLAYGLAWTELGGALLTVEAAPLAGSGQLILTGNLGDVMKESAKIALSFIRTYYNRLGLHADFMKDRDLHIHVPEGAIPKDGPSAGITLVTALLSALAGAPMLPGIAMTGEITLTGRLLPVGGIKEKMLAAFRNKLKTVILPADNRKDTEELPAEVL
ncbi:MAG: endopeptidase La, partial [Spirochaetales bacterium]